MIKVLKTNLKKLAKLTEYFQINLKKKIMITLATQHLKMVVANVEALEVLVVQIFQIYLRISLGTLVVEVEEVQEEVQIIEGLI